MKKILFCLVVLFGLCQLSRADQPTALGNVKIYKEVYSPVSQVTVATSVPVGISATNMVIKSTAGIVTFFQVNRTAADGPAITTSTALSGQYLILSSTTSVDTVVITTGTATAVLSASDATITISSVKPPMAFIFDATNSVWRAIGKQ